MVLLVSVALDHAAVEQVLLLISLTLLRKFLRVSKIQFEFRFQYMHCFEGHQVVTLGEISSSSGAGHQIHELDDINRLVQVGKAADQFSVFLVGG
jgi:hypothetical protein